MLPFIYWFIIVPLADAYKSNDGCRQKLPKSFDYIVVGAGAAGATIAARLSEDPDVTVCLLEAGRKETEGQYASLISTPRFFTNLDIAKITWNTTTVPQRELNGRKIRNGMGKVLGGSTSRSGMVYYRGFKSDFDYWAENGAYGWDFDSLLPFFLKSENNTISKLMKSPIHNKCGPVSVSQPSTNSGTPLWKLWTRTAKEKALPVGECNRFFPFGICLNQFTIRNGERESTSTAFLRPAMGRKNLFVVTEALVGRVLISTKDKRVYGIRFFHRGRIQTIKANKEVIVSGGAIESPKLLQISGIGPKSLLNKLKIRQVLNLPVGVDFHDHVSLTFDLKLNVKTTTKENMVDPNVLAQYIFQRKGLYAALGFPYTIFLDLVKQRHNWPEIQIIGTEGILDEMTLSNDQIKSGDLSAKLEYRKKKFGTTLFMILSHPKSKGTIVARSGDPKDAPLIDPKYFSRQEDFRTFINGIRRLQQILRAPSMREAGARLTPRVASSDQRFADRCSRTQKENSDGFWTCMIRQFAASAVHPVRSCPIGDENDKFAVVDPYLRVRGIKGLRVADASVMPEVTSANTMAPAIMIGERAAYFIKNDNRISKH